MHQRISVMLDGDYHLLRPKPTGSFGYYASNFTIEEEKKSVKDIEIANNSYAGGVYLRN